MDDTKELKRLRTRWLRWLGQKIRCDRLSWVTIFDDSWLSWAKTVIEKHKVDVPFPPKMDSIDIQRDIKRAVKNYFLVAINHSDMEDLRKLNEVFHINNPLKL